jgi:hypothetical protein
VSSYDQIIKQIIATSPSWEKDGGGIRGRTIAPILSGLSSSGLGESAPQIFNQQSNQTIQRSANDPVSDLILDGGASGGTASIRPFELKIINTSQTQNPIWNIRIYPSTLVGGSSLDLGFSLGDDPPFLLDAEDGIVEGKITIDEDGNVVDRTIQIVANLSANTLTDFYVEIGTVVQLQGGGFSASNSRYGPIDANICRDWFTNPPTYGVTFISGNEEQP